MISAFGLIVQYYYAKLFSKSFHQGGFLKLSVNISLDTEQKK